MLRIFNLIFFLLMVCPLGWAAENQKLIEDQPKAYQDASLRWNRSELIGYTYRWVKNKNSISYTFSEQDVMVAITSYDPKSDSFVCPLVGPLHWFIDDKGILNVDGAPVFKWTASWLKVEEHDDKIVVINRNGEKETYIRQKNR
jgi:hypothetical protein